MTRDRVHPIVLGRDMFGLLRRNPVLLTVSLVSTIVNAALAPSQAWAWKKFVDHLQGHGSIQLPMLFHYILLFGGLHIGLGLLSFGDRVLNRAFDLRQIISLQRTYLERRGEAREAEDVSRLLFDCGQAKPLLDVMYKSSWQITASIVSVMVWQLKLAPAWLPGLAIAVIPPVLIVFGFGNLVQNAGLALLRLQGKIASSTGTAQQSELFEHQESFFRQSVRLEFLMSGADTLLDLLKWLGLLLLVAFVLTSHAPLLPQHLKGGDVILFVMNLDLISRPLGDIGRVYNQARQAYPAMLRILSPHTVMEGA